MSDIGRRKAIERQNKDYQLKGDAQGRSEPASTARVDRVRWIRDNTCDGNADTVQPQAACFTDSVQNLEEFERTALNLWAQGSPRTDLLLSLIKFNVFRALIGNTAVLGFSSSDWLNGEAISPFYQGLQPCKSADQVALSLQPSRLQMTVEHHPWIDLFPFPEMRDNILRIGSDYDDAPLCHDLVENHSCPGDSTGLIVWGDPWIPSNWEVSEDFAIKWGWVVYQCWELYRSTNQWRARRGNYHSS